MSLQAQREDGFRPGGRTSWTRRPQAAIQETTRIVRVFPSTLLWPLALLGILLGVGIWGVTRALQMDDNSAKDRASRLAMETAEWFRFQVQMAAAPVTLMAAMVNYNPQYEAASGLFRGLAPTLMSQTPLTQRAKALELAPHGVTRDVFPAPPNGVMGYDIFNSTLPGDTEGATRAVQQGQATLVGPLSYMQSDRVLIVRNPVFISGVASDETFGIAAPSSYGSCGEPCAYNATTRTKFWGFVSTLIDLQGIIQAEDSKLKKLGTLGYRFEVEAMGAAEADLRRVAASSALPTNPVEANVTLPNGNWVVRVAPKHGWTPRLYSGLLAAVVIFAVAVSLLLFWALLSRARHKILVEALLPRNLSPASGSEDGPRCQHSETAADMLLGMLSDLLEGYAPDIGDVLFIRTVLMRNMDVYQPLNLRGHIKGGNLDADVVQSLMQQLGEGSPLSAFKLEVEAEDGAGAGGLSRKPSSIVPHNLDTIAGTLSFLLSPDGLLYGGDSRVSLNARLGSSAGDAAAAMAHFAVPVSPSPCGVVSRQSSSGSMCSRIRAKQRRASVSSVMRAFSSTEATTTENEACGAACDGDVEALGAVGSLAATASGDEAIASLPSSRQPPGVRPVSMVASLRPVSSSGLGARFMSFVRGRRGSMDACMFGEGAVELQKRPSRLGLKLSAREGGPMSPSVTGEGGGYVPSEAVAEAAASTTCNVVLRVAVSLSEVEQLLAQVDSWQYDMWRLQEATQGHALSVLGFHLMQRSGVIKYFGLSPVKLARLLRQIEAGYQSSNPYHNATHAADVLQTLHVIVYSAQLHVHYLDPLGLLAAYYAAIVHDYGHPGLTSDFLIATSDSLAVRYNDRSPLENHHCAASFSLLLRPELDLLAPLSPAERSSFRKQVIEMVLATDMKQHFSILSHFSTVHRLAAYSQQQQQQQQHPGSPGPPVGTVKSGPGRRSFDLQPELKEVKVDGGGAASSPPETLSPPKPVDETERLLSLQVALKCADIGHLGEALEVHKRWLVELEEEFFRQGDRERQLGLPISSLFDRAKQGVSKSQVGFYEFVALPLVHALSSAFPGAQPLMRCFVQNYNHWRKLSASGPEPSTAAPQTSS